MSVEAQTDDPQQESELEASYTKEVSKISLNTEKRRNIVDKEKAMKEKKNKVEEFMLFDIDKNNATPNKENQRLMQSFDIVEIALAIIKTRVDRVTNYNEMYKELIKSCYRFLISYVRGNF